MSRGVMPNHPFDAVRKQKGDDGDVARDKNAVVYGTGGAIGSAVTRAFASEGARVFLGGRTLATLDEAPTSSATAGASEPPPRPITTARMSLRPPGSSKTLISTARRPRGLRAMPFLADP
jgi:NAD(P)-dependent dehydrogenase (short-subunit alcohol dehydrogenase family)